MELDKCDTRIYTKHLEGMSNKRLSQIYNLSESGIRRIILKQCKGDTKIKDKLVQVLSNWALQSSAVGQIYNTT